MRRVWRLLRIVWTLVSHTAVTSVAVCFRPPGEREAYRARRQQQGTARLCRILGVHLDVTGTPPEVSMLVVCNHLGVLDPLVLASTMPLAFAGKAELRRWPLIGWVCTTYGVQFVERERPTKTSGFVRQVGAKLAAGVSMLVFPEGTTSDGTCVQPFKTGAFEAVAGEEAAVLPLYLKIVAVEDDPARHTEATWADEEQTFAEHCWYILRLRSIRIHIRIGEPVPTAPHDRKELARRMQGAVSHLGEQARVLLETEPLGSAA